MIEKTNWRSPQNQSIFLKNNAEWWNKKKEQKKKGCWPALTFQDHDPGH